MASHINCGFFVLENFYHIYYLGFNSLNVVRVNVFSYFLYSPHHHDCNMFTYQRNVFTKLCLILIHFYFLQFLLNLFIYFVWDWIFWHEKHEFDDKQGKWTEWYNFDDCEDDVLKFKEDHKNDPLAAELFQKWRFSADLKLLDASVDENKCTQEREDCGNNVVKAHEKYYKHLALY